MAEANHRVCAQHCWPNTGNSREVAGQIRVTVPGPETPNTLPFASSCNTRGSHGFSTAHQGCRQPPNEHLALVATTEAVRATREQSWTECGDEPTTTTAAADTIFGRDGELDRPRVGASSGRRPVGEQKQPLPSCWLVFREGKNFLAHMQTKKRLCFRILFRRVRKIRTASHTLLVPSTSHVQPRSRRHGADLHCNSCTGDPEAQNAAYCPFGLGSERFQYAPCAQP